MFVRCKLLYEWSDVWNQWKLHLSKILQRHSMWVLHRTWETSSNSKQGYCFWLSCSDNLSVLCTLPFGIVCAFYTWCSLLLRREKRLNFVWKSKWCILLFSLLQILVSQLQSKELPEQRERHSILTPTPIFIPVKPRFGTLDAIKCCCSCCLRIGSFIAIIQK